MSKPANIDIQNLFQKFGGDPSAYKEIRQEHDEERAQLSWPLITAMRNELPHAPKLKTAAHATVQGYGSTAPTLREEIRKNLGTDSPSALLQKQEQPASERPLHSLFDSLGTADSRPTAHSPAHTPETNTHSVQQPQATGSLNQVFSRLLDSPQPEQEAPQNDLRSMLGRLNR